MKYLICWNASQSFALWFTITTMRRWSKCSQRYCHELLILKTIFPATMTCYSSFTSGTSAICSSTTTIESTATLYRLMTYNNHFKINLLNICWNFWVTWRGICSHWGKRTVGEYYFDDQLNHSNKRWDNITRL